MKYIQRVFALLAFLLVLAGCATTGDEVKQEAAPAAAPAVANNDPAVKKDVEAALAKEPQLKGAKIAVGVKDGDVTLSGEVKNDWLKYLSEETAKKANKDVKSVKNSIKVPD